MIVGNKIDLADKRQVSIEEGEAFARKEKSLFIECTATDKTSIMPIFKKIATFLTTKELPICEESKPILTSEIKKQTKSEMEKKYNELTFRIESITNEMESKYNELNSKIESKISEMESKYNELNSKIEKIASEMKKQKLGNEMSSKNDELEYLTNNIIERSTVFCKLYNNPVVIKKIVSKNEIIIELNDNSTDIVNLNDLCFIHFK